MNFPCEVFQDSLEPRYSISIGSPSGLDVACAWFVHIVHCVRQIVRGLFPAHLQTHRLDSLFSTPHYPAGELSCTGPMEHSGGPGVSLVFVPHWISSDAWPACAAFTGGNKPASAHLSQTILNGHMGPTKDSMLVNSCIMRLAERQNTAVLDCLESILTICFLTTTKTKKFSVQKK